MKIMSLISTLILLTLIPYQCWCECHSMASPVSPVDVVAAAHQRDSCKVHVTETIPIGMSYPDGTTFSSTIDDLLRLCHTAQHTLDIASFYWTLLGTDVMPNPDNSSVYGEDLLAAIEHASTRGVTVRVAVSQSESGIDKSTDLNRLKLAGAQIRLVNFTQLLGAGVLHTKFILADAQSFYVGSANMDWRSLSQVKELGVIVTTCPTLGADLLKIFQVYWYLGEKNFVPNCWPESLITEINSTHPLEVNFNTTTSHVYISSSPRPLNAPGRTNDIDAILSTIEGAEKFINIAVMDYFPLYLYSSPSKFWPVIDDALKKVVIEKGVKVRLLASVWQHTRKSLFNFLSSLHAFRSYGAGNIEVKVFQVPSTRQQSQIPFARVNHNKYMVTDSVAYIGTSNWSADYFSHTGGVALVAREANSSCYKNPSLRDSLIAAFERDWNSQYSHYIDEHEVPVYTL